MLRDVVRADAELARQGSTRCWSAELSKALAQLGSHAAVGDRWAGKVLASSKLDLGEIGAQLQKEYCEAPWQGLSELVRAPAVHQRKAASYNCWWRARDGAPPLYLTAEPLRKRAKLIARFRTGGCTELRAERDRRLRPRVRWESRTCTRCSEEHRLGLECGVDDEWHLVFECQSTQLLREEEEFRGLIAEAGGNLQKFAKGEASGQYILRALGILAEGDEIQEGHAVAES